MPMHEWKAVLYSSNYPEVTKGPKIVARLQFAAFSSRQERQSAALLIAAAPEMALALENLLRTLEDGGNPLHDIIDARKALMKAKGE